MLVVGCAVQAIAAQSLLSTHSNCSFLSGTAWQALIESIGGMIRAEQIPGQESQLVADVPLLGLFVCWLAFAAASVVAASIVCVVAKRKVSSVILSWLDVGCRAWFLVGAWECVRIGSFLLGWHNLQVMLETWGYYFFAISMAGWSAVFLSALGTDSGADIGTTSSANSAPGLARDDSAERFSNRLTKSLWLAIGIYVVVFTWMNWELYWGLLLPHGDSAMYEEHLWNVLHGKGFRSYLDQGLFLGEHIQVVHLFLLPIYFFFPSHLTMELAETLALASGSIPVFWMARRWSGSAKCATCLAVAYLAYPPTQFLDIAIDLKTFRPMPFGMAAMLFAFDQFERGRLKTTLLLFGVALSAKEDYALVLGPLGIWFAAQTVLPEKWRAAHSSLLDKRKLGFRLGLLLGIGLAVFAVGYLLLATRVVIPWFREGGEVHYARYFAKFGGSMGEILKTMLTNPGLLFRELITIPATNFTLGLLVPLGFAALLSPTRFLVGVPILVLLCLNEIIQRDPHPYHHFHGPIIAVLFWSVAAGLQTARRFAEKDFASVLRFVQPKRVETVAAFVVSMSFFCGVLVAMSPCSIKFWDSGSTAYWKKLYVAGERASRFELVFEQIPLDARVASTDYVHPRFTHHERSYDYSQYVRRVADYQDKVPDDTDFIVIDCKHRYSKIQTPDQVRELKTEPDKWELLDDKTDGYFIVLKRRR